MKQEEKKVLFAYIVKQNEDGSIDVEDASENTGATQKLENSDIFASIEDIAEKIKLKRVQDAAFVAAYNGTAKFFEDLNKQNKEKEEK